MPDGSQQQPGGWNRVLLEVQDLAALAAHLKGVQTQQIQKAGRDKDASDERKLKSSI